MASYVIKLVAAFIRSRVLRKNTVWPTRPNNDAEALARLSEDFQKIFAEAEGYCSFDKDNNGLLFGDAEDIACIRKMRARLALLEEGGHDE